MIETYDNVCVSIYIHRTPEDYLTFLTERGRRPATIIQYRLGIKWCTDRLEAVGRPTEPDRVKDDDILYLTRMRDGVKESTVRYNIEKFNGYIKWATGRDLLTPLKIQWNRPQRHRKFITKEDFRRMYELATPPQRMVLVLGAYMGLRRSEIVGIDLDDIGRDHIVIRGKGHGPDGLVVHQYMPVTVREELDRYMTWRRQYVDDSRRDLLIRVFKGHINTKRVTDYAIAKWIDKLAGRVGVEASPHSLRRLYCTSLYNHGKGADGKGADLRAITTLTRHSDVKVLFDCYIDVDPESVRSCAEQLNIL